MNAAPGERLERPGRHHVERAELALRFREGPSEGERPKDVARRLVANLLPAVESALTAADAVLGDVVLDAIEIDLGSLAATGATADDRRRLHDRLLAAILAAARGTVAERAGIVPAMSSVTPAGTETDVRRLWDALRAGEVSCRAVLDGRPDLAERLLEIALAADAVELRATIRERLAEATDPAALALRLLEALAAGRELDVEALAVDTTPGRVDWPAAQRAFADLVAGAVPPGALAHRLGALPPAMLTRLRALLGRRPTLARALLAERTTAERRTAEALLGDHPAASATSLDDLVRAWLAGDGTDASATALALRDPHRLVRLLRALPDAAAASDGLAASLPEPLLARLVEAASAATLRATEAASPYAAGSRDRWSGALQQALQEEDEAPLKAMVDLRPGAWAATTARLRREAPERLRHLWDDLRRNPRALTTLAEGRDAAELAAVLDDLLAVTTPDGARELRAAIAARAAAHPAPRTFALDVLERLLRGEPVDLDTPDPTDALYHRIVAGDLPAGALDVATARLRREAPERLRHLWDHLRRNRRALTTLAEGRDAAELGAVLDDLLAVTTPDGARELRAAIAARAAAHPAPRTFALDALERLLRGEPVDLDAASDVAVAAPEPTDALYRRLVAGDLPAGALGAATGRLRREAPERLHRLVDDLRQARPTLATLVDGRGAEELRAVVDDFLAVAAPDGAVELRAAIAARAASHDRPETLLVDVLRAVLARTPIDPDAPRTAVRPPPASVDRVYALYREIVAGRMAPGDLTAAASRLERAAPGLLVRLRGDLRDGAVWLETLVHGRTATELRTLHEAWRRVLPDGATVPPISASGETDPRPALVEALRSLVQDGPADAPSEDVDAALVRWLHGQGEPGRALGAHAATLLRMAPERLVDLLRRAPATTVAGRLPRLLAADDLASIVERLRGEEAAALLEARELAAAHAARGEIDLWQRALEAALVAARGDAARTFEGALADANASTATPPLAMPHRAQASHAVAWWTDDAGAVLLAAYLPRLFDRAGLLFERGFVDDAAQRRAFDLVVHAVWGGVPRPPETRPDRIAAVLVGLEPEAPPMPATPLESEADRTLVDGLLAAMIAHWSAIGRTSVAGLREAFLQRPGVVRRRDEGLHLRVEARAYDMLLDRLPWTYRVVRHPWMPAPLTADWRP